VTTSAHAGREWARLRITLVAPSLAGGGAERVTQLLATGFEEAGNKVTVITTSPQSDFYSLPDEVQRVRLDLVGKRPGNGLEGLARGIRAILELRRAVVATKPNLVISVMDQTNVLTLIALLGTQIPRVITEHTNARAAVRGRALRVLRRVTYPTTNLLVSVSRGVDSCFGWLRADKRVVIANPVSIDKSRAPVQNLPSLPIGLNFVVGMGRLTHEKGFDLLLAAFAEVADAEPSWHLLVLGDGELRGSLEEEAIRLDIGSRVTFLGALRDPFQVLEQAKLFVLSSRVEGFGNVLIEAMACGLPVLSFACEYGPAEIIDDGSTGLLVEPENTDALAAAMKRLMEDPQLRSDLAMAGKRSASRFELEMIVSAWEAGVFRRLNLR
jgi:GalNAc-alpha-(1->4)-GalNAc-alpha-(1->3)-diNAcBac-PP-undecaprenol alpha-1,4-N-acetyl-D-galactosaminyltransferase